MTYEFLIVRREAGVEYLTLNRPEVRNALNERMIAELGEWAATVSEAARRHDVRAIVLNGAGSVFCAGGDAKWMSSTIRYSEAENIRDARALADMFVAIDMLPVPVICGVHGAAVGGGAGLAAVCDIVVAEEGAVFGFPEVKLGIVPGIISPFVIAKIGPAAARELFLTGARFSAERAKEIGLVHALVPAAGLDEAVARYAREVLLNGPEAVAAAKALVRDVVGRPVHEAAAASATVIAKLRVSAEGQEGLTAFLEKRTPSWINPNTAAREKP